MATERDKSTVGLIAARKVSLLPDLERRIEKLEAANNGLRDQIRSLRKALIDTQARASLWKALAFSSSASLVLAIFVLGFS